MKHTKRVLTWILAVLMLVLACSLVACVDKPQTQRLTELTLPTLAKNQMAVIIKNGEKDYTSIVVTLGESGVQATTVEEVLAYLVEQDALKIDWTDSQYGKTINGIGGLQPNSTERQFVSVLTSVGKDKGTYAGVTTYEVGSVQLASSAVGVSSMTVEAGAVIYFEIATY